MTLAQEQTVTLHRPRKPVTSAPASQRWSVEVIEALFALPFPELLFKAQTVHREHFNPTQVEFATLLSVKTVAAPKTVATARNRRRLTPVLPPPR